MFQATRNSKIHENDIFLIQPAEISVELLAGFFYIAVKFALVSRNLGPTDWLFVKTVNPGKSWLQAEQTGSSQFCLLIIFIRTLLTEMSQH